MAKLLPREHRKNCVKTPKVRAAYLGQESGLSLLHVEKLQAGYGSAKVLFDVGFVESRQARSSKPDGAQRDGKEHHGKGYHGSA